MVISRRFHKGFATVRIYSYHSANYKIIIFPFPLLKIIFPLVFGNKVDSRYLEHFLNPQWIKLIKIGILYISFLYIYIYLFPITLSPILATVVNTLYLHLALFGFHHNRQRKGYQQRIQDLWYNTLDWTNTPSDCQAISIIQSIANLNIVKKSTLWRIPAFITKESILFPMCTDICL